MANVRVPVRRRIRPAGWIVILLAIGGAGYGVYALWGSQIRELIEGVQGHSPAPAKTPAKPPASVPSAGHATPQSGNPPVAPARAAAPAVPPPAPPVPSPSPGAKAVLAVPPLQRTSGLHEFLSTTSELEAIRLVAAEKATVGVTSVAALAAAPEAQVSHLRVVRLLGFWPREAAIGPSCDLAKESRSARLGAIRGSLAHYEILRLTNRMKPRPDIALFDDEPSLTTAFARNRIIGELPLGLREGADLADCALPASDFAFVAVQHADHPVPPEELDQLLGPLVDARPAEVAAFAKSGAGSFGDVFERASKEWASAKIVSKAAALPENLNALAVTPAPVSPADAGIAAADAGPQEAPDAGVAPQIDAGPAALVTADAGSPALVEADAGSSRVARTDGGAPGKAAAPSKTVAPAAPAPASAQLGFPSWVDR